MVIQIIRFNDLQKAGIVKNRVTLSRWIDKYGFPSGFLIGPNSRGWYEQEIDDWLSRRRKISGVEGRGPPST